MGGTERGVMAGGREGSRQPLRPGGDAADLQLVFGASSFLTDGVVVLMSSGRRVGMSAKDTRHE